MRDDGAYLELIAESIALINQYIAGSNGKPSKELFEEDSLRKDAVLRRLEILADAASHLSEGLKARHPSMPWRRIGDFRNVLAHAYLHLQLDRVWRIVANDLPILESVIHQELNEPT